MFIEVLKSKIHRVTVTEADLDYIGSITIDEELLEASGIIENQKVEIYNISNGERFATYTIAGERGSGIICLNGAAARCACVGDKIILMAYCQMTPEEAREHKPSVVFLGEGNKIERITDYEKHGVIA